MPKIRETAEELISKEGGVSIVEVDLGWTLGVPQCQDHAYIGSF